MSANFHLFFPYTSSFPPFPLLFSKPGDGRNVQFPPPSPNHLFGIVRLIAIELMTFSKSGEDSSICFLIQDSHA